jgi:hypothetical protein
MFDNLADPLGPLSHDALDAVLDRAQRKRHVHIRVAAVCVAAALTAVIVGVGAAAGSSSHKMVVSNMGTSTTTTRHPTTSSSTPPSTAPSTTSPTTKPGVVPPPTQPATTTTTLPPSTDASHIVATFTPSKLTLQSGDTAVVHVTFMNKGPWPFLWEVSDNACGRYEVDGGGFLQAVRLGQHPLWPTPQAVAVCTYSPPGEVIAPGATKREDVTVLAGQTSDQGKIVPAFPGTTCFSPAMFGIGPDTTYCAPQSVPVTITPPASPPFTANRPTSVTVVAGKEARVPFTLTNELPFAVDYTFDGARTIPSSGADDCLTNGGGWECTVHMNAHQSLALILDVWGTENYGPPSKTNKALIPGQFDLPWNEKSVHLTVAAK